MTEAMRWCCGHRAQSELGYDEDGWKSAMVKAIGGPVDATQHQLVEQMGYRYD